MLDKKNIMVIFTLSLIIFIKFIVFYNFINISDKFIVSLISLIYIALLFSITKLFKDKYSSKIFITVYTVFSLILFIDLVYFKYFNELSKIIVITQVNQLSTVTDSIFTLIKPIYLTIFIDIPIIYYLLKRSNERKNDKIIVTFIITALLIILVITTNILDISFIAKIQNSEIFTYHIKDIQNTISNDAEINKIKNNIYLTKRKLSDESSKYYGIGKGKNLILIQIESFQNFSLNKFYNGQELTPNLNKLIKGDTLYFDNYYQTLGKGNTSDAEFSTNNSLYPIVYGQAYKKFQDNKYYGLPWILKDNGYKTIALHGYKEEFWYRKDAYPYQGFDKFISEKDYEINKPMGFGINDIDFFDQSVNYLEEIEQPFYSFLITLTSHHPYDMRKEFEYLTLKKEHEETLFGKYMQAVHYTDKAVGEFIDKLKEDGLYDNSIIAIYGDHHGLNIKDENVNKAMTEFLGYKYDYDEMLKVPLIINIPGSKINETISTVGSQVDFMPTIANIMGIENETIYFGKDLVSANSGFVPSQTYLLTGSFIKDNVIVEMSRDGIFNNSRAWDRITKEKLNVSDYKEEYEKALVLINTSNYILENDLIKKIIFENKTIDEILGEDNKLKPEKLIGLSSSIIKNNPNLTLEEIYKNGFKFIEVDMNMIDEENALLINNWNLNKLSQWMKEHKDVYIVTNIKKDNEKLLKLISKKYSDIQERIIPQIYSIEEYNTVKYLGYTNIILNTTTNINTDDEIIYFAENNNLLGVTILKEKIELIKQLNKLNIFTYTYKENDYSTKDLEGKGINGFYINNLMN